MPQRKTRKLCVRAYFPLAMSASRFFNVSSSSPTLAGVPLSQFFVGQVMAEVGEVACPDASKLAAAGRKREATRTTQPHVFFMISLQSGREPSQPETQLGRLAESAGL